MFKVILYIVLLILINYMVIGEPTWQLLTSKLWLFIISVIAGFAVGFKCCEDENPAPKTIGATLMILCALVGLGFCFVPHFRHWLCWYIG